MKDRKFNKDREWLIEEYVIKDRPRKEVAAECGLTESGFKSILIKYNVNKNKIIINKDELQELINQQLSAKDIAKKLCCGLTTVYRKCKEFGFKILADPKVHEQYDNSNDELIC